MLDTATIKETKTSLLSALDTIKTTVQDQEMRPTTVPDNFDGYTCDEYEGVQNGKTSLFHFVAEIILKKIIAFITTSGVVDNSSDLTNIETKMNVIVESHNDLVDDYKKLLESHNSVLEQMRVMVEDHNNLVISHNNLITAFNGIGSGTPNISVQPEVEISSDVVINDLQIYKGTVATIKIPKRDDDEWTGGVII